MRTIYDNVAYVGALFTGALVAALTGSTAVTSAAIDTKGYNTAMLVGHADASSSTPSVANMVYTITECDTSGGSYTAANDNAAIALGFTLDAHTAVADNACRIEGLGDLNRKRYLKVVITPSYTGGTSPSVNAVAYILLGRGYQDPVNSAVSNT